LTNTPGLIEEMATTPRILEVMKARFGALEVLDLRGKYCHCSERFAGSGINEVSRSGRFPLGMMALFSHWLKAMY
jgi:hypothetical protein